MNSVYKIKKLYWFAVAFLFLMSASILIMPMAVRMAEEDGIMDVLIGCVFWISAIAGYTLLAIANSERRWFIKYKTDGDIKMGCFPGIISFFTNVPATVADVTMIASCLLFAIISSTSHGNDYVSYVLLFLLVFSLHMHCLFNGRIYKSTKFKRTRREKL